MAHLQDSLDLITQCGQPRPVSLEPDADFLDPAEMPLPNPTSHTKTLQTLRLKLKKTKSSSKAYDPKPKGHRPNPSMPQCRHWSFTFYDFDEKKPAQDSRALVHSVFAVVSASLRHHHHHRTIRKQTGKKRNRRNGCKYKYDDSNPNSLSHQHVVLENLPNLESGTTNKLWHLCIKWNPQDSKDHPSTIGGSVTKTRIRATLGAENSTQLDPVISVSNDTGNCLTKRPRLIRPADIQPVNLCQSDRIVCCQCHTSVSLGPCHRANLCSHSNELNAIDTHPSLHGQKTCALPLPGDAEPEEWFQTKANEHMSPNKKINPRNHWWCKSMWNYPPYSNHVHPAHDSPNYCGNCYVCKQAGHLFLPNHWHLPNPTMGYATHAYTASHHPEASAEMHPHQGCYCLSHQNHAWACPQFDTNRPNQPANCPTTVSNLNWDFELQRRRSQSIQNQPKRSQFPNPDRPKLRSRSQPLTETERQIRPYVAQHSDHHHFSPLGEELTRRRCLDQPCPSIPPNDPSPFVESKPRTQEGLRRRKSELGPTRRPGPDRAESPKPRSCSKTRPDWQDRRDRHQNRRHLGQQQVQAWLGNSVQQGHFSRSIFKSFKS